MQELKSLCVFCGSRSGSNPAYEKETYALGKLLAQNKIRLIYGGGNLGLMGAIAKGVSDHHGNITGIIPEFLNKNNEPSNFSNASDEIFITQNMHERKMLMFEKADAFVALPGGIGTLEEMVEQLTWAQLGQHKKPLLLANFGNFWQPFLDLLDHMKAQSFTYNDPDIKLLMAATAEGILPKLNEALQSSR